MQLRLESVKRIGRKIHIDDDKGYAVAILLALIIVFSLVIGYYVVFKPQPEGYNTIYLLDAQKKAVDYPEVLVANQNSTFKVYVNVVNHLGKTATYQVQVKITKNLVTLPVDTQPSQVYDINNLADSKTSENMLTVIENGVGSYSVVFELWQQKSAGTYEFTSNYCVLNIQVTD